MRVSCVMQLWSWQLHYKPALQKHHSYGESGFAGPSLDEAAVARHTIVAEKLLKNMLHKEDLAAQSFVTVVADPGQSVSLFAVPANLPYQQLRASLLRWRRAPEGRYQLDSSYDPALHSEDKSRILTRLVQQGALPDTSVTCSFASNLDTEQDGERQSLQHLLRAGMICQVTTTTSRHHAPEWQLTPKGASSIACVYRLIQPSSVVACMTFREAKSKDLPDEKIYDVLWKRGWVCTVLEKRVSSKKLKPFKQQGEKKWYLRSSAEVLPLNYMRVLVDADVILASGLMDGIPHLKKPSVHAHILDHHKPPPVETQKPSRKPAHFHFMDDNSISLDATAAEQARNRKRRRGVVLEGASSYQENDGSEGQALAAVRPQAQGLEEDTDVDEPHEEELDDDEESSAEPSQDGLDERHHEPDIVDREGEGAQQPSASGHREGAGGDIGASQVEPHAQAEGGDADRPVVRRLVSQRLMSGRCQKGMEPCSASHTAEPLTISFQDGKCCAGCTQLDLDSNVVLAALPSRLVKRRRQSASFAIGRCRAWMRRTRHNMKPCGPKTQGGFLHLIC